MSYYEISDNMYQSQAPGTPSAMLAPVPGWGANPRRAGPPILAANGSILPQWVPIRGVGDSEQAANEGYIALAAAGGLFSGWFLCWVWHYSRRKKKG